MIFMKLDNELKQSGGTTPGSRRNAVLFIIKAVVFSSVRYWRTMTIVCPLCGTQKNGIESPVRHRF